MLRTISILSCVAAVIWAGAQRPTGQGVVFRDKKQNMVLSRLKSWKITKADTGYTFLGSGSPFEARWNSQGLVFTATRVEGVAKDSASGLRLESATFDGPVTTVINNTVKGTSRTTTLSSTSLNFSGGFANPKLDLNGKTKVVSVSGGDTLSIVGNSADVALAPFEPKPEFPILRSTFRGNCEIIFKRNGSVSMNAVCNLLVFDDKESTVTLTGNVKLEGENDAFFGEAFAERAVITLNSSRKPVNVEMTGEPGRSSLGERKDGQPNR